MSPTRPKAPLRPIELDLSTALQFERGVGRSELLKLAPRLASARQNVLQTQSSGAPAWTAQRLLDDYLATRRASTLGCVLRTAKHVRDAVDHCVMVGTPESITVAQALFAACCHPFHNQLARGERGGRPRIDFIDSTDLDNDHLAALLDVLPTEARPAVPETRWTLIRLDPDDAGASASPAAALLRDALARASHESLPLSFEAGRGEGASASFFSPTILLASSVMGMDIVELLRGAAAMEKRVQADPVGDNPPLDLAGACHLLAERLAIRSRAALSPSRALLPLAHWYQRAAQATAATSGASLLIQIIPDAVRRDPLRVTMPPDTAAGQKKSQSCTLPELSQRHTAMTRDQSIALGSPLAVIRLSGTDESSVGQLAAMFSLSIAIERTLGPDPLLPNA